MEELIPNTVVPVYLSEISPARLRGTFIRLLLMIGRLLTEPGRILTSWQTGTALGTGLSGAMAFAAPSWRFQISSSFVPAVILLTLVFVGSESPRWLIKKRRYPEAYNVPLRPKGAPVMAARDMIAIRAQLNVESILFVKVDDNGVELGNQIAHLNFMTGYRESKSFDYLLRITQLFTIPRVRRATLASLIIMIAQLGFHSCDLQINVTDLEKDSEVM